MSTVSGVVDDDVDDVSVFVVVEVVVVVDVGVSGVTVFPL